MTATPKRMTGLLTLTAAVVLGAAPAYGETERFFGIARSKSGAVLYKETHQVEREHGRILRSLTRYSDEQGRLIAELSSDYRKDPFAPDYRVTDAGGRVIEAAQIQGNRLVLGYKNRSETRDLPRRDAPRLVTGQGLDHLVRERLDSLADGSDLLVTFAIPSRFDTYAFRIHAQETARKDIILLKITIDDWFLALLAPSLEVEYDRAKQRLLSYRGVSNLRGPEGETMNVQIRYSYEGDRS